MFLQKTSIMQVLSANILMGVSTVKIVYEIFCYNKKIGVSPTIYYDRFSRSQTFYFAPKFLSETSLVHVETTNFKMNIRR